MIRGINTATLWFNFVILLVFESVCVNSYATTTRTVCEAWGHRVLMFSRLSYSKMTGYRDRRHI